MNIHMEATGELVSSPRERETREMKERAAISLHSNVGNPSLDKRQIATRDKGQLSNRNLRDPSSYLGNSSGRDCMVTPVELMLNLNRCLNFYLENVFGVPLEIGSTSCRDGNKGICSSLGHGHSKSKSLLHTDPVLIASRESDCPSMVDLELTGLLLGMKARGKFVIDHNEGLAPSLIEGTTACGDRVYPVYGVNSMLWSRSLLYTYVQEGRTESMGGAPGRAGAPIIGGEPLLHPIGDFVSDSYSVNLKSAKNDHVLCTMLPTSYNSSSLASHALRQAFPIWSLSEISHPCVQFSSCHNASVQGDGGLRVSNAVGGSSTDDISSPTEWTGMCNYLTAAYIFLSNAYQWILIAVLSAWYVISSPQSFWNVGMWFQPVWNILGPRYSSFQPCQRALTANSDSYFGQITAKLLQNFCFEPQSIALCWGTLEFMGSACPDSFVNACGIEYISTFENLLHQGVLAFGR